MDANFFRFFFSEVGPSLHGKRFGKIYQPNFRTWTLQCASKGYLIVHVSRKSGALFLSSLKPDNPEKPSPKAQWWRKRLTGRRIEDYVLDWSQRQVALRLSQGEGTWLVLDIVRGLELLDNLPDQFGEEPVWPDLDEVDNLENSYKIYPQLSPPLRQTLKKLERQERYDLLEYLKKGPPDWYSVCFSDMQKLTLFSWPLPASWNSSLKCEHFLTAKEAAFAYGWQVVHQENSSQVRNPQKESKRVKRIQRKLARVQEDEDRLRSWLVFQDLAELIQMNLYRLDHTQRVSMLELENRQGTRQNIHLEPKLTILENMHQFYKKARKARRGLDILETRRQMLKEEVATQKYGQEMNDDLGHLQDLSCSGKESGQKRHAPWQRLQVRVYKTSDDYIILRGKNQKANHQLLSSVAKPCDLWFHARYGPGAHVILQRDNERQSVPRRSIVQAAVLAGLASHQALDTKGDIMCALVKHVRKLKGAPLGEVRVDTIQETLRVSLDQQLEKTLRIQ
jgi:predicted ribosome quality control (RQC) complex YloA/Tae2 family protein